MSQFLRHALTATLTITALPAQAELIQPTLSIDMNGEYRCDNGKAFTAKMLSAAVVRSELRAGTAAAGKGGIGGTAFEAIQNDVVAFDLYGAAVTLDGKEYRMMLQDGNVLLLLDAGGYLQWQIDSSAFPYAGRLLAGTNSTAENCIHLAAATAAP